MLYAYSTWDVVYAVQPKNAAELVIVISCSPYLGGSKFASCCFALAQ